MTSSSKGLGIPFRLPPVAHSEDEKKEVLSRRSSSSSAGSRGSSSDRGGDAAAADLKKPKRKGPPPGKARAPVAHGITSAGVKTTRTRTVKSRVVFEPDEDKKETPKRRGRPPKLHGDKRGPRSGRRGKNGDTLVLHKLLEDEKGGAEGAGDDDGGAGETAGGGGADGHRKRSRNASDGENRWDRIRGKFKILLHKMRKDLHFLEVYQQDGWKSSGREKLKPKAELQKAKGRVRSVKMKLREVVKRLTEMNSEGSRWLGLEQDADGNIDVGEVMCTKCSRGDTDDHDDILLCDHAGCFRAYHQKCLTPPIKPEAFPSEEEDWFCWQCECLMDCLEMLENEFQGQTFESWESVFPNVEAGLDAVSGEADSVALEDSEDSDDESFEASSSESEDQSGRPDYGGSSDDDEEEEGQDSGGRFGEISSDRKRRLSSSVGDGGVGDSSRHSTNVQSNGDGAHDGGDEDDDEDKGSEDEEFNFINDAESVASDELEKLKVEAGDLGDFGEDEDGGKDGTAAEDEQEEAYSSKVERDRETRARIRRLRRAAQLGLSAAGKKAIKARQQRREMVAAAQAGDGTVDAANILKGRRNRTAVDYVKLNDSLFGDDYREELDENKSFSSSDGEKSFNCSSDESPSARTPRRKTKQRKPGQSSGVKRKASTPTIDPLTGKPRGRGRPRIHPLNPDVPKRPRGRPRKNAAVVVSGSPLAEGGGGQMGIAEGGAVGGGEQDVIAEDAGGAGARAMAVKGKDCVSVAINSGCEAGILKGAAVGVRKQELAVVDMEGVGSAGDSGGGGTSDAMDVEAVAATTESQTSSNVIDVGEVNGIVDAQEANGIVDVDRSGSGSPPTATHSSSFGPSTAAANTDDSSSSAAAARLTTGGTMDGRGSGSSTAVVAAVGSQSSRVRSVHVSPITEVVPPPRGGATGRIGVSGGALPVIRAAGSAGASASPASRLSFTAATPRVASSMALAAAATARDTAMSAASAIIGWQRASPK